MEKNDFEKKTRKQPEKMLLEKIDFSIEKIKISRKKIEIFFKMIFLHDEKIFFDGIFLKSYLLIEENRLEAIPE